MLVISNDFSRLPVIAVHLLGGQVKSMSDMTLK